MSSFRPPTQQGDSAYNPPWTASTDASEDDFRPTTSAGRQNQWSYQDSRPTTSHHPNQFHNQQEYMLPEEEEEEYEESEDEDVFAYLPPNTAEQQQLARQQQQQQQQLQRQQIPMTQTSNQPFAYNSESLSVPNSSSYYTHPSATTASTPYSPPVPITPASAVPYSQHAHAYSHFPTTVSSPPDSPATAPPFAYDPPTTDSSLAPSQAPQQRYESFAMTPMTGSSALSTAASDPQVPPGVPVNVPTGAGRISREVHVSLPPGIDPTQTNTFAFAGAQESGQAASGVHTRSFEQTPEDGAMRYRKDSKRTRGSSYGSNDLIQESGSIKTDISISAGAPPYTPDSLPSTNRPTTTTQSYRTHDPRYYANEVDDDEQEDSPYPEVRASVSNIDDPDMPALTFRMWVVGLFLCVIASGMNTFFNFRYPAPYISALVLLLIGYPFGKFMAYVLPITTWTIPSKIPLIGGSEFSLNPGPFNVKEHALIYIMANVSINPPYAMNVIVVTEKYYGYKLGFAFNLFFVLATQLTGFGLAGMCRRFLVWPASLIWPVNLVACTLLNTLHAEDDSHVGASGMSRYRFYMLATLLSFLWYFFPGFIFQALSFFSFICWIRPNNVVVNQLFGVTSGLGMSFLTFDWAQISYIGSPLMVPWWAQVHIFGGFVIFYWILCPIMYYNNVWKMGYLPMSGYGPYDRFGQDYNVTRVIDPATMSLNVTAYQEYSPLYLSATYAITYMLAFMLGTAILVHTILYHGRALLNGIKRIKTEEDDIHAKLMRNYPEVPDWWYLLFFCFFFGLAILVTQVRKVEMPVWALFVSVAIPIIYVIPSTYIYAITGQPVTINLIAQIIPGVLMPGKPLANMIFKCYSIQTMQMALAFTQDLKLGHYIKIAPRGTFTVQAVATILAAIVQVGVKEWLFANVPNLCTREQEHKLVCPNNEVYFASSAVWGLIGPTRQFGAGTVYHAELYSMIAGALLPLPFWFWQKRYPKSKLKYISMPVLLNGPTFIPPATGINYSSWFVVGFIFQYLIRRRNFRWWSKFNYILSAALDSGTVLSILLVFFALQFPKGGSLNIDWWGNNVYQNTADMRREPYIPTPEGGF